MLDQGMETINRDRRICLIEMVKGRAIIMLGAWTIITTILAGAQMRTMGQICRRIMSQINHRTIPQMNHRIMQGGRISTTTMFETKTIASIKNKTTIQVMRTTDKDEIRVTSQTE